MAHSSHPDDGLSQFKASLFDLQEYSGHWRWAVLLAVGSACLLGWSAYRRRLDTVDRIRLAVVHTVVVGVPMLVAGLGTDFRMRPVDSLLSGSRLPADRVDLRSDTHTTLGLALLSVLVANLLWTALGALALPPLLSAIRRRPAGPDAPAPPPFPPPPPVAPAASVVVEAPTAPPAAPPAVPAQYVPEVLDSHEEFRRPAGS